MLTKIAHLDWFTYMEDLGGSRLHLLPDTLIRETHIFRKNRTVFRVVDYRTKDSICFSADVDVKRVDSDEWDESASEPDITVKYFSFFPRC